LAAVTGEANVMPHNRTNARWKVLVVDDDESIRDLIISKLSSLRMQVTGASDGGSAIAMLERSNGQFGLVITDINLPGADGFEVLKAAHRVNAACYVVIVTGYASVDSAVRAVRLGAYDYLPKPFSLGQLDVVLMRIADRVQLKESGRCVTCQPSSKSRSEGDSTTISVGAITELTLEKRMLRFEAELARIKTRLESLGR
jgi:DNA-binding NtrC family response regulator